MPYIREQAKEELWNHPERKIANAGELNYMITCLVLDYLRSNGSSYQYYNDCIGALEGAKLELYRRQVAPYEDDKCLYNGDVYQNDRNAFVRSKAKAGTAAS